MADAISESGWIGLTAVIGSLRAELIAAQEEAEGQDLRFPIEKLTVELKVAVTRSVDGKAGFKVPLLGAQFGGSAGYKSEELQTITVTLGAPLGADGTPITVDRASERPKE